MDLIFSMIEFRVELRVNSEYNIEILCWVLAVDALPMQLLCNHTQLLCY